MGLGQQLKAQEEFLKLDSVVVIEKEINLINQFVSNSSHPFIINGVDSLSISVGQTQLVKLKSIAWSFYSQGNNISQLNRDSWSSSLKLGNLNLINYYDFDRAIRGEGFYSDDMRTYFKDVDLTLTDNEYLVANLDTRLTTKIDRTWYRIELVYYSYEN